MISVTRLLCGVEGPQDRLRYRWRTPAASAPTNSGGAIPFGNVRERPLGETWTDTCDPLLAGLKDRKPLLTGRSARCQYLDLGSGNFRVGAEAVCGDVWAPDPACYLTDEEIGL